MRRPGTDPDPTEQQNNTGNDNIICPLAPNDDGSVIAYDRTNVGMRSRRATVTRAIYGKEMRTMRKQQKQRPQRHSAHRWADDVDVGSQLY
eukprot:scaffold112724_cov42-Attheya_sp.AAC.3